MKTETQDTEQVAIMNTKKRKKSDGDNEYKKMYSTVSASMIQSLLSSPPPRSREEMLIRVAEDARKADSMDMIARGKLWILQCLYQNSCTAQQLIDVFALPQGGPRWKKMREGLCLATGTMAGKICNWSKYANQIKEWHNRQYVKFATNEAMQHGTNTEPVAAIKLINVLNESIQKAYVEQRSYETGALSWFGHDWKLSEDKRVPIVLGRTGGMIRDPHNLWAANSADLFITVRAIPGWDENTVIMIAEIKCPFDGGKMRLYGNLPLEYAAQMQHSLYHTRKLWPNVRFCLNMVFSIAHNYYIEVHEWNPRWYFGWYQPREWRFIMGPALAVLAEKFLIRCGHIESLQPARAIEASFKEQVQKDCALDLSMIAR